MKSKICPKCKTDKTTKSGIVKERQRFHCKKCGYHFSVEKEGKSIDPYYVIKALQLHIEGVTYREIERILGVSHVSVINWVKKYKIKVPENYDYAPSYKVLTINELSLFIANPQNLKNSGMIITELGDKYMMIKWERLKG